MQYDRALRQGRFSCMLRVDDDVVLDPAAAGNASRYINHCCQPNCVTRTVE